MVPFPVPTDETRSLFPNGSSRSFSSQRSTFPTTVVHLRTNLRLGQCLLQIKIHFPRSTFDFPVAGDVVIAVPYIDHSALIYLP